MEEGHEYFANQEEVISNKFMSANGEEDNFYNQSGFSKSIGGAWIVGLGLIVGGYIVYKKYGTKGLLVLVGGAYLLVEREKSKSKNNSLSE